MESNTENLQVQVEHWPKVTGDRTVAVPPLFLLLLLPGDLLEECPASSAPSSCSPETAVRGDLTVKAI